MFLLNVFYFYMFSLGLPFSILDSNGGKEIRVFTNQESGNFGLFSETDDRPSRNRIYEIHSTGKLEYRHWYFALSLVIIGESSH